MNPLRFEGHLKMKWMCFALWNEREPFLGAEGECSHLQWYTWLSRVYTRTCNSYLHCQIAWCGTEQGVEGTPLGMHGRPFPGEELSGEDSSDCGWGQPLGQNKLRWKLSRVIPFCFSFPDLPWCEQLYSATVFLPWWTSVKPWGETNPSSLIRYFLAMVTKFLSHSL